MAKATPIKGRFKLEFRQETSGRSPAPTTVHVRLLLTGRNLAGARIEAPFRTGRITASATRSHLFIELLAADDAYEFARVTGESRVVVVFNVAKVAARLHILLDRVGIRAWGAVGGSAWRGTAGQGATKRPRDRAAAVYR